jgi:5'-3' exonuclease
MENLIFDGNYLLYKNVNSLFKMNVLYGELYNFLNKNVEKFIGYHKWKNVILVSDSKSKSWRSELTTGYKGKRVKNDDIDWDFVFETYEQWKLDIQEKYNITVYEYSNIEGDDYIASLIRRHNKLKMSNLVVASDHDLLQFIKYKLHETDSYINLQVSDIMGKEKLFIPVGYELWLDNYVEQHGNDIFVIDNSLQFINFIEFMLKKWTVIEIDKYGELFKKIVQGDASDNITSVYRTLTKTGKLRGIGEKTATKLWEFYKENIDSFFSTTDDNFLDDIILCIEKIKKIELDEAVKTSVKENIKKNIKLIELHNRHFPDWVNNKILEQISYNERK